MSNSASGSNRILIISIIILFSVLSGSVFYIFNTRPNIAFVRTMDLVYNYNGMRDARNEYKAQSDMWQSNIDTLQIQYQSCLANYQNAYKTLNESERKDKELLIKKLENNLRNYTDAIHQKAEEKEKNMTDGVLNQINSYVEEYSKKKGYDLVIGSNNSTLLYGAKSYDITDEVLAALNKEYKLPQQQNESPIKKAGNK